MGRLPHFLIIGAARCGTSSLFSNLLKHPKTRGPNLPLTRLTMEKECHFFDKKLDDPRMKYTIQWYKDRFVDVSADCVFFEATPNYLYVPKVPELISRYMPRVKFIVMLRNPVDRAWSHFYHWQNKNRHPIEAVKSRGSEYVQKGIYWKQLEQWFKFFRREQFLIIKSEDFFADEKAVILECFEFLGLPKYAFSRKAITYWDPRREYLVAKRKYPRAPGGVINWLRNFYLPHNDHLERLLDRKFYWD